MQTHILKNLQELCHPNKYFNWMISILNKEDERNIPGEIHHIIPKSINSLLKNDHSNLIYISYRKHFLVHRLLVKCLKNERYQMKMKKAIHAFCLRNDTINFSSKDFEIMKKNRFNYKHSQETKDKMSKAKEGKIPSNNSNVYSENLKNINRKRMILNNPMKQQSIKDKVSKSVSKYFEENKITRSLETKQKQRISKLGSNNPNFGNPNACDHFHIKYKCPKCGKETTKGNLTRWHSDDRCPMLSPVY